MNDAFHLNLPLSPCFVHIPYRQHAVNDPSTGGCRSTIVEMSSVQAFIATTSLVFRAVRLTSTRHFALTPIDRGGREADGIQELSSDRDGS